MNVREWVWNALCEVIRKETYSNLYLKEHLQEVDEKDRALASNIFYGTLQNYALCQAAWKRFAKGKVKYFAQHVCVSDSLSGSNSGFRRRQ